MSRQRKRRGVSLWTLILFAVLIAAVGYEVVSHGDGASSLRTIEELDPELYYANANSLRGNTYRIDAEIDSSLGNSPSRGRLFSVRLRGSSGKVILPVLVPLQLATLTIQKGQHYMMKVKVADSGLLCVEEARKP